MSAFLLVGITALLTVNATDKDQCESHVVDTASIREDLFAANHLLDDIGWLDSMYQHISYRYNATKIVMPQIDDTLIESQVHQLPDPYNQIYSERADINVILHVLDPDISAVSFDPDGILPLDQQYYALHPITYNVRDLLSSTDSFVWILPNGGGALCTGQSMHDAFYRLWYLKSAVQSQVATLSILDKDELIMPSQQVRSNVIANRDNPPQFVGYKRGYPEFEALKRKYGHTNTNVTVSAANNEDKSSFRETREEVAKLYNLIATLGFDEMIYNHITARLPTDDVSQLTGNDANYTDYLLINPFGLHFSEVTAENLIEFLTKVEVDESNPNRPSMHKVLNAGNAVLPFGGRVFVAGLELHAAVHSFRSDVKYALHIHHAVLTAIGCYKHGLLPLNQVYYDMIKPVRYHSFGNFAKNQNKMQLMHDIGDASNVIILRNHGIMTMGETLDAAFNRMYYTLQAAKLQISMMKMGLLSDELVQQMMGYMDADNARKADEETVEGEIASNSHLNWWQRLTRDRSKN